MATFNLGRSSKKGGGKKIASQKPKRKLPKSYGGCGGDEETKHVFQMYGNARERCVKCSAMHESVAGWVKEQTENGNAGSHPYIAAGIWTVVDYQRYMKKGGVLA